MHYNPENEVLCFVLTCLDVVEEPCLVGVVPLGDPVAKDQFLVGRDTLLRLHNGLCRQMVKESQAKA